MQSLLGNNGSIIVEDSGALLDAVAALNFVGFGVSLAAGTATITPSGASAFTVGPLGSGAAYTTIGAALTAGDAAFPADPFSVFVYPGTYSEDVTITRSGVSITGFSNQSFQTLINGDLSFTPSGDDTLSLAGLVINGHFIFDGSNRGQVWLSDFSVQANDADPAWNLVNQSFGSRVLASNPRGVNTSTGLALLCDMEADSEVRLYGGNSLLRNLDRDLLAVDISGAGGFCFLLGPGFSVDGQLRVRGNTGALLSNVQVRTDSVSPVIMDGTANSGGFPLNSFSFCSIQATAGTAVGIDSTAPAGAFLSYYDVFNLGAAAPLNPAFNPAQVFNSSTFLIP